MVGIHSAMNILNKLGMGSIDQEMFSISVDAGLVLVLPFHHGYLEPDCRSFGEGWRGGVGGGMSIEHEAKRCYRG